MTIMAGMKDLKPAKVVAWIPSSGHIVALCRDSNGDGLDAKEFEMFIDPTGKLFAKEYVADTTHDQTPLTDDQREERAAMRWAGVDQS
jgi:hypothetical protein